MDNESLYFKICDAKALLENGHYESCYDELNEIEQLLSTPSESGGEVYKSKAEAWDMICKLCPHNQDGIANCCVSMQDDYCQLMRDMKQSLNGKEVSK